MSFKAVAIASILAAALLSGCSAKVPTGTVADAGFTPTVTGGATAHYQAASGKNAAGQVPTVGSQLECQQPPQASPAVPPCRPAFTDVKVNVTAPKAGDGKYAVYLVNATAAVLVAELTEGAVTGNMAVYSGMKNFTDQDLTGHFTAIELRLDAFVLATAPATEGAQTFMLAEPAKGVTVTDAAWDGHTLTGTVAGLPANATYQGNLYLPGADGKAQAEPAESFAIDGNGAFTHTSTDHDIGDFAEFHVHVDHSKVNLYKATIQKTE